MEKKDGRKWTVCAEKGICLFLFLISVLSVIKTIWVSLDIDESYALAVGYRLAMGERFFSDLWEPHQLGGIVLAPFVWLYLKIAGTTTYLVVYARIVGTLLHLAVGIFLYKTAVLKGMLSKTFSLLLFFLHFIFLPKWVQCPEFELQQYWFALLCFLCFYRYYQGGRRRKVWLFLAGVSLLGQMFSYPILLVLYPVYLLGIFFGGRQESRAAEKTETGGRRLASKEAFIFTAGAGIPGALFLLYLRSYMSAEDFFRNVGYIFLDESHTQVTTAIKWKKYGEQWMEILPPLLILLFLSLVAGTLLVRKKKCAAKRECWAEKVLASLPVLLILSGLLQGLGGLFGNENQFYMSWRFFAVSLLGAGAAIALRTRESRRCLWFGILPGVVILPAVLVMTNMDVNVSIAKMYASVLAVVWMAGQKMEEPGRADRERFFLRTGMLIFLAGLFVCRLVQIRVSGCEEVTVLAPMQKMEEGPAKGIYMVNPTAYVLEADYKVLKEHISPEDKLLYIGNESIVYLWTGAKISTPSTLSTNAYNEIYLRYYEEYPEKVPTVIAYDKELEENPAYLNSPYNYIIYDWMEEMGYREVLDAEYMILYRR